MRTLVLLLFIVIFPGAPQIRKEPDVEILKFAWRKLPHNNFPSGKKAQEMRDANIDESIRAESMQNQPDYARIRALEAMKKNRVPTLDVPVASDKAYEYKFKFRNMSIRRVVYLKWLYVFNDAATGQELVRHYFESKLNIAPGQKKEIIIYRNEGPPRVVNAKAMGKSRNAWEEKGSIEVVQYSDGSQWVKE